MSTDIGLILKDDLSKIDQLREMLDLNDWMLIVSALHHSHADDGVIPEDVRWGAYCKGDGFGNMAPEELKGINDGWDWSHIRDSSNEGQSAIAGYLRTKIRTLVAAEHRGVDA